MVAEVCSVYVRRPGDVLELFATQGLKPTAVHNTRLAIGEGIIGDIAATARPFALADAQSHPNFAYRPETGEEIFHSMMGVPILRGGRVIGVVAVQNRTQRHYVDEEVETLQTVAMVLAELVAGGELVDGKELSLGDGSTARPLRLEGIALSPGIGMGTAVLHAPKVNIEKMVADDPNQEIQRLHRAFSEMHGAIDDLLAVEHLADGGEHMDVLETYRLIAEDAGWLKRIEEGIETGLTAEASVQRVQNDIRARMSQISDAYLRERVHDLDDLAHRLMVHLSGENGGTSVRELADDSILIARSMGPAQLLDYDYERLKGVILEEGAPTSHVAIVARALGIPVVGKARDIFQHAEDGDTVIVDADRAQAFVRPGEDALQAYVENLRILEEQRAVYEALLDQPARSLDGVDIDLQINAGLMIDVAHLSGSGASGIGLFRTEIPFMVRAKFPGVDEQAGVYREVLDEAGAKPVVFRTLDIGGDKALPYWQTGSEENPAIGWRAVRLSLDRPALLRQQLRALIRAATGRELNVLFPMVADVPEFIQARALVDKEMDREKERGGALPSSVRVGAMLEVPSLAVQLETLLDYVDFLSVGSNDLGQFLFASDRGNPKLSGRYDTLSPVQLKFLKSIVDTCRTRDVHLSLCGEMAGSPLEAMALLGVGFRRLSMAGTCIGPVKAMVRSLDIAALEAFMDLHYDLLERTLREQLKAFAIDRGVAI